VIEDPYVIRKSFAERPKVRIHTLAAIRIEMGKVYRYAQRGEITWADATRAVFILAHIAKLDQGTLLEQRLADLERRLGPVAPNGYTFGRPAAPSWDQLPPQ
jgi:hypothetical protein